MLVKSVLKNEDAGFFVLSGEARDANLVSGADLIVYSDDLVTEVARIDGATGSIVLGAAIKQTNAGVLQTSGYITFKEDASDPTADTNYAKIWTDSTNSLWFQDGDGVTHLLHADAFSHIWYHGPSAVTVSIGAEAAFTKIDSFINVGREDDLANVVGSAANNELVLAADAGGAYDIDFHGSIKAVGASKEMIVGVGIELATAKTITLVTDSGVSPIVITSAGHGLMNGDMVEITGVGGNTNANGSFIVDSKTDDTFEIVALGGAATTGNANYTSGGSITLVYPGDLLMHREVSQIDLIGGGSSSTADLAGSDKVGLYVANLDDAGDLSVFQMTLNIERFAD